MTRSFSSSPPRGTGTPQQPRDVFNRLVSDRNKERVAENVDLFKKYWDLLTWNNVKRGVSEAIDELLKVQNRARLLAALGVIGTLGTSYIIFSEQIRSFFGRETAEVAREVLKNEGLQDQTLELANAAVRTVLNDPEVRSRFMAFLRDTASSPDTQNALVSLSLNILQHPDVLKDAVGLGKEVWLQLVSDPETLDQLTVVLAQALADERSKEAVVGLIQRLAADDQVTALGPRRPPAAAAKCPCSLLRNPHAPLRTVPFRC